MRAFTTSLISALFVSAATLAAPAQDCAVSASPHPIRLSQPTGEDVVLRLRGSAFAHWYEDARGYPVVELGGWYMYASTNSSGDLVPTSYIVGRDDPQPLGLANNVVPSNPSGSARQPSPSQLLAAKGGPIKESLRHPGGTIGADATSVKNLVILVEFSDHGPTGQNRTLPSNADFGLIMNAVGGDPTLAPTGSVRDHYLEGSYGSFTLDSDIAGWVVLPDSETYYAAGSSGLTSLTWDLITDALNLVDATVDFSDYDQDGDGVVDAITFLHSGYGAEWGGTDVYGTDYTDRMWSHKWSIPTWSSGEGVTVSDYNISPGLWATSGSDPGRIGVVAHELGHFFGLPDMYDTDGSSNGDGNWALMASGSWGFDGSQYYPTHMSAWSKSKLGWLTPEVILPGVHTASRIEDNQDALRIDSGYPPGEYLLIENKRQFGFDAAIPQQGLAVWHVDESKGSFGFNDPNQDEGYPGQAGWPTNGSHYRAALLQADDDWDLELDNNRGDSGDVYRAGGGGGVTTISGATSPNLQAYQGGTIIANGNVISSISSPSNNMTFNFSNASAPTITTSTLAGGNLGVAYSESLAASGGTGGLGWSEYVTAPAYATIDEGASLYSATGVAQGWQADEAVWSLSLPFSFPYYETAYDTVYVSSNGFLDFAPVTPEPVSRTTYLKAALRISPFWGDLRTDNGGSHDVYVDTSVSGQVKIRWRGEDYNSGADCRFAVVLFEDGRIRFDYGSGNSSTFPTVGISRSHSADFILIPGYDGSSNLGNADSWTFTPTGSQLPPGLSVSANGTVSGTPTAGGTYSPLFKVQDTLYTYDLRQLDITITTAPDCNSNGVPDDQDISMGTSLDCNLNGIPDECEPDCNTNGVPDDCDISAGTSQDCNANNVPDECDIAAGTSLDCNANGIPDECEVDCNANGVPDDCDITAGSSQDCNGNNIPDECDIAAGTSLDCNVNGIPDECEADCNTNGVPDDCDITAGTSQDCNSNGVPDECDISAGTSLDCNLNGIPDECELDCNANGVPDDCDIALGTSQDCNANGVPDECDISAGTSLDCNGNGIPDECEADCNANGVPDDCDITAGTSQDCNSNGVPDECDISAGTSLDCNLNGIPDECELDCNANGVPDDCDIALGTSQDCNANGIPDECDISAGTSQDCNLNSIPDECEVDCNTNGIPDDCDIALGTSQDCNSNGIPDECDISAGTSLDCNSNGVPDECEADCNANGVPDDCDITAGTSQDCNSNGVPDECDIAAGTSLDCNANGIPDECEADCNANGVPDDCDITAGTSQDCNSNGIPDECDISAGTSLDCNLNGIPDECEPDCNANGVPDDCDIALGTSQDCNSNGIPDECDIASGTSLDCNANGIPDECEVDCNANGVPDDCDIALGTSQDCNSNGIPDECDISAGTSLDCNTNGVPDECEPDCNANGIPDDCDISSGTSQDCNSNGVPDECDISAGTSLDCNLNGIPDECEPDCNNNGMPDDCDIALGTSQDCNSNGVPDECDIAAGTSLDCNLNGIPDECEPDCNANGVPDDCDIALGTSQDCNSNGIPDECDISSGTSQDCNLNGIPDECEPDCNLNGVPDDCDIALGTSQDCNSNGVPDECDIAAGTSLDCNSNGIPDECEPDCNSNGVPDDCDITAGTSQDCNSNGVPDECDISAGTSLDCNANGIPDECEADCNTNGVPDDCDITAGTSQDCNANGIPDECDISSGLSQDTNTNGIPDECECLPAVSYCTTGTSANGCQAVMSATGLPSASATSGFVVDTVGLEGQKDGLIFFGTNGRQANAWGNGTSFQCVVPPVRRTGIQSSGGTAGACDGAFSIDFTAWMQTYAFKAPAPGSVVQMQTWYRDPQNTSNQTTSLSDALEFVICN